MVSHLLFPAWTAEAQPGNPARSGTRAGHGIHGTQEAADTAKPWRCVFSRPMTPLGGSNIRSKLDGKSPLFIGKIHGKSTIDPENHPFFHWKNPGKIMVNQL